MINQHQLKKLFKYKSGKLFYRENTYRDQVKAGTEAGSICSNGYRNIQISGKTYKRHRLIFLIHNGYLPEFIDHIDGDRSNDDITNLRKCTFSQNQQNKKINKNNTSGVKGISFYEGRKKPWLASLFSDGNYAIKKFFVTKNEAIKELRKIRVKYHGKFANHGQIKGLVV